MKSSRTLVPAIALLVAIFGATTVPAFAGLGHPVCAAKQHECGKTARITKCCCGDAADPSNQGGPVQSRVQLATTIAAVPCDFVAAIHPDLSRLILLRPSTPRAGPVDLPTLFACLLI